MKEQIQIKYQEEVTYYEGGDASVLVAWRSCGCPMAGSVQDQFGLGSDQPGQVKGVPAHSKGLGIG